MKSPLYHTSFQEHKVGTKVNGKPRIIKKGYDWVEHEFERLRPTQAPSRKTALFAFDTLENCAIYIDAEPNPGKKELFFYEVKMPNPRRAPMVLVNIVSSKKDYPDIQKEIIEEYWNPSLNWNTYEYLDNEITIMKIVSAHPDYIAKAASKVKYMDDLQLAKQYWG